MNLCGREEAYSGWISTHPKEGIWKQTLVVLFHCGQIRMDWEIQLTVFINFCLWGRVVRLRPRILGPTPFVALKKKKNLAYYTNQIFFLCLKRLSWTLDSSPSATIKNSENLSCLRWCHKTLKNAHCWVGHRSSKHSSFCQLFRVFDRLGGLCYCSSSSFFFHMFSVSLTILSYLFFFIN